jgi:hypothetical protein
VRLTNWRVFTILYVQCHDAAAVKKLLLLSRGDRQVPRKMVAFKKGHTRARLALRAQN